MTALPATMTAIALHGAGGPEVLQPETRPVPLPGPGEILVKVAAAGVNRPDVVQRLGNYAPPPGASDIPGLEVSGTVVADGRPRIVNIKGIRMDAEFAPSMVYITNLDKPGFIGRFSSTLGEAGINIATFHVGREAPGGSAVALIEIDGELPADVLAKVRALPQVQSARPLHF